MTNKNGDLALGGKYITDKKETAVQTFWTWIAT